MTSAMRTAMVDEARLFFESIVRENRSVVSFVTSDYTFLNATLAKNIVEFRDANGRLLTSTRHQSGTKSFTPSLPFSFVRRAADYSRSVAAVWSMRSCTWADGPPSCSAPPSTGSATAPARSTAPPPRRRR